MIVIALMFEVPQTGNDLAVISHVRKDTPTGVKTKRISIHYKDYN